MVQNNTDGTIGNITQYTHLLQVVPQGFWMLAGPVLASYLNGTNNVGFEAAAQQTMQAIAPFLGLVAQNFGNQGGITGISRSA